LPTGIDAAGGLVLGGHIGVSRRAFASEAPGALLMTDPYAVLGLPADADDAAIRGRYLALVKEYPPEAHPQKFAAIRQAYEHLKDLETRVRYRLFEAGKQETIAAIIEEVSCPSSRPRLPLTKLLALVQG
jgi:hypothetical protein